MAATELELPWKKRLGLRLGWDSVAWRPGTIARAVIVKCSGFRGAEAAEVEVVARGMGVVRVGRGGLKLVRVEYLRE